MSKQDVTENLHERARGLIDQDRIEGLAQDERFWLEEHLSWCEACTTRVAQTEASLQALKSVSVGLPRGLAASTSLRVRAEAARFKQRRSRNVALIVGCAISWVAGAASAPLVWRLFEWMGTTFDLPRIVWQLGFLSWWLVPAASAGLVILWVSGRAEREDSNGRLEAGRQSTNM